MQLDVGAIHAKWSHLPLSKRGAKVAGEFPIVGATITKSISVSVSCQEFSRNKQSTNSKLQATLARRLHGTR